MKRQKNRQMKFEEEPVSQLLLKIQCSRHSIDNNNDLNSYLRSVMRVKHIVAKHNLRPSSGE